MFEDLSQEDRRQGEALAARVRAGANNREPRGLPGPGHPHVTILAALSALFATWLLVGGFPAAAWQSYVDFRVGQPLWAGKLDLVGL